MLVYVFSDFQGVRTFPEGKPDLVILLGDIDYRDALKLDRMYTCPKIGVYGNHDSHNEWAETSIQLVHGETFEHQGVTFGGFGGSPRYNMRKWNQYTEKECEEVMRHMPAVDVFIAHSNPAYEYVGESWDAHKGFRAFDAYIESMQPSFFLHGHIHESNAKVIGATTIHSVFPFLALTL